MEFILSGSEILIALCKARRTWGLLLSAHGDQAYDEVFEAVPYLTKAQAISLWDSRVAYLLFEDEDSCYKAYRATKGDDGPTDTNPYTGPGNVYALVCDPRGVLQTENT